MRDRVDQRVGLRVFDFHARDEQSALAFVVHDEGNRSLGGDEGKARVIDDVVTVEQDDAAASGGEHLLQEMFAALAMLCLANLELKRIHSAPIHILNYGKMRNHNAERKKTK